jgi:ABC-2 type transport system permease protein
MNLVLAHFRAEMLGLLRTPAFSVITVLMPGLIFLFVGAAASNDRESANLLLASFCIFALLGVAFFQFGVGLAQDRGAPWDAYLRTLPVTPATRFAARLMAATVFALAAVAFVIVLAVTLTDAGMAAGAWVRLVISVLAAAVPAALLGIAVGYWASPKAALPVANILYLAMSFGGGLFIPPDALPGFVDRVSVVLPTRQFGELAWAAVLGLDWPLSAWLWVAAYTVVFGAFAVWGYRRDEGTTYR